MSDDPMTYEKAVVSPPKTTFSSYHKEEAQKFLAFVPSMIPKNSWQVFLFNREVYLRNDLRTTEVRQHFLTPIDADKIYQIIGQELTKRILTAS